MVFFAGMLCCCISSPPYRDFTQQFLVRWLWQVVDLPTTKHCLWFPCFRLTQRGARFVLRIPRPADPVLAEALGVRRQQELQSSRGDGLDGHEGLFGRVRADGGHLAAEQEDDGRFVEPAQGARDARLDLGFACACSLHVEAHLGCQRQAESFSRVWVFYDHKSPRLEVMCRGSKSRSGEDALDNGIRYRVRPEAADGAPRAKEVMKVHGLFVHKNLFRSDLIDDAHLTR